jgi:SPX domain protein involved in polyphosphate accumulation
LQKFNKSQTKSSSIEYKPSEVSPRTKLIIDETDPDSFWKVMEVILGEKAQLSQKEITNFIGYMKKVRQASLS